MLRIVSLLGPSGFGKSTLSENLKVSLADRYIMASTVRKDDAIREISTERFGPAQPFGAFSLKGLFGSEKVSSSDLHRHMNAQILAALAINDVVILEGGTRTRKAQAETLADIDLSEVPFGIMLLQIPPLQVIQRLVERRRQTIREDDTLPILAGKLLGQYLRPVFSGDAPKQGDPDVYPVNATITADILTQIVTGLILDPPKPDEITSFSK